MTVKVHTKYGLMLMDILPKNKKLHEDLQLEPYFVDILENENYENFIDIGAGWGYFSIIASHYANRVLAFEPHPSRLKVLKQNKDNLNLNNLFISSKAVGTGLKILYINPEKRGMIGPPTNKRTKRIVTPIITLENILKNSLNTKGIIKIDIEGNELDVIQSAGNLTKYKNYIWLIERHYKKTYGYCEEDLLYFMKPFTGKLLGVRKWTSHYVFKLE